MDLTFRHFLYCGCIIISGCASVRMSTPPNEAIGAKAYVVTRLPIKQEKFSISDIPNSHFGISGASGSLVAGLLLGPIGVLANNSYVQSKNSERSSFLTEVSALNLADIMRSAVPHLETPRKTKHSMYALVPAARIDFINDETFRLSCIVNAEFTNGSGITTWKARYSVSEEPVMSVTSASLQDEATTTLSVCFKKAYALFVRHTKGNLNSFTVKTVKTKSYTFTLPVSDAGSAGRVIGNDGLGLVEFLPSDVIKVE